MGERGERKMRTESGKGGLWFTAMRRIVLDNHNSETFSPPYDRKLMTAEELKNGIKYEEFAKRLYRFGKYSKVEE